MPIIKFINDPADFTANTMAESITSPYFSDLRIRGYACSLDQAFTTEWVAPADPDLWMHFTIGYNNSGTSWDENNHLRIEDSVGTLVASSDIRDGFIDWNLFADTTDSLSYRNIANARLIMDLHFVRNGTTDISLTVYVNGTFQGTLTGANANAKGMPQRMSMTNLDTNNGGIIYWGECVLATEDTRGWRLYQLRPTAFGIDNTWDGEATSVTDGSLLTGISTDVLNERTSFGLSRIENIPDSALIDRLAIQTYGQRGEAGLTSFNHYWRYENGTRVDDADIALGLSAAMFLDEYSTNPNTGVAWLVADIQGLQLGVRART